MRDVCLLTALLALGACGGGGPPGACTVDGECPVHQYCDAPSATCASGCLSDADCPGASCDPHGRCVGARGLDGGADFGPAAPDLAGTSPRDLSGQPPVDAAVPADAAPPPDLARVDAWICTGTCPDYMLEPNGTPAKATAVGASAHLPNLAICPVGDVDYFHLPSGSKGTLHATVTLGPCGAALTVDLFDSDGKTLIGSSSPTASGATASAPIRPNQTPYIRVEAASSGGQNFYTLDVSVN